jgi:hypothetical protein
MARLALVLGALALGAVALPAPGALAAVGLGVGAIGTGWIGYGRRHAPGASRLVAAAALTLGLLGLGLGAARFGLTVAAVAHLDRMLDGAAPASPGAI